MAQYIDKDALVAEIERQISAIDNYPKLTDTQIAVLEGNKVVLTKLLSFLNTLEAKEADLTREDVSKIISIDQQVCGTMGVFSYTRNHQQAMEEVLKRFKAQKGE